MAEGWGGVGPEGRCFVVTGGASGLGRAAAARLAGSGAAAVVIAARGAQRAREVALEVQGSAGGTGRVLGLDLDLTDLSSVLAFPGKLREAGISRVHGLLLNAGVMFPPERWETAKGWEATVATNHLGHFALANVVMPFLVAGGSDGHGAARVVMHSSMAHSMCRGDSPLDFSVDGFPHYRRKAYGRTKVYAESKAMNIFHAAEFNRRLVALGLDGLVEAMACHPGASPTELQRHMGRLGALYQWVGPLARLLGLSHLPEEACLPLLRGALDQSLSPGAFVGPKWYVAGPPVVAPSHLSGFLGGEQGEQIAGNLWDRSVELTGTDLQAVPD